MFEIKNIHSYKKMLINVQMIFLLKDIVFAHFIWQAAEYTFYCACVEEEEKLNIYVLGHK